MSSSDYDDEDDDDDDMEELKKNGKRSRGNSGEMQDDEPSKGLGFTNDDMEEGKNDEESSEDDFDCQVSTYCLFYCVNSSSCLSPLTC